MHKPKSVTCGCFDLKIREYHIPLREIEVLNKIQRI